MRALIMALLVSLTVSLAGQGPSTIVYKGILADEEGQPLVMKTGNIEFQLFDNKGTEIGKYESKFQTDSLGCFYYGMLNIPAIFRQKDANEELKICVVLSAGENCDWMEEDKLVTNYTLEKLISDKNIDYKITRKEGLQVMNQTTKKPVWKFTDRYPFMYLQNTFMVSFSKEVSTPQEIVEICNEMEGGNENKPANSRGIKGGYAVGGYNRN